MVFGVEAGMVRVDGRAVMSRLRRERERFLRSIFDELDAIPRHEKMDGHARFTGPTTLMVDDRVRVQAKAIVAATGASSSVPKSLAQVKDCVLTSETVFDANDLPRSITVVGAGPLGIELGTAFTRLGVRTALFDTGKSVGGLKDQEVGRCARELFQAELDLRLGVEVEAAPTDDGVRLRWRGASGEGEAEFERVLAAAGRPPNLQDLDLQAAGLTLDDHGVPDHDVTTLRCGDSAIFMAGDADHNRPVLHQASREGRIAGTNAARFPDVEGEPPDTSLSIVFTDPDMASIGQPLSALGGTTIIGGGDLSAGRGLIEARPGGMIRLYAGREDKIIVGGEMVGPAVEHLAHCVAVLVQQTMTADAALALPFYHPTYEERLKNGVRDLLRQFGSPCGTGKIHL